ncbi:hypothetical protein LC612_39190 [Nostoc sp. CHAB 5834]|nr:hypothetical protein [Nostoc sp. CHAB 5834]
MYTADKRTANLALLSKIIEGTLNARDIDDLRKSREPIYLTFNLGDDDEPQEPTDPTYHIEISDNWKTVRRYNQYADGRIEELD